MRMSYYFKQFIVFMLFVSVAGISCAAGPISHQIALPVSQAWCDDSMINSLFDQINLFRSQQGVPALKMDPIGMKTAELRVSQFATYMATHAPGSAGFNPHEGYEQTAASVGYNLVSENLAYLSMYPGIIVYSIWQDPMHRAALLTGTANVAGVSCVFQDGTPYWAYDPGISQSAPTPTPSPTPTTPTPTPSPTPSGSSPSIDSEELAFLTLINNYRAQNGAPSLQLSATLQTSSRWMSNDMASKNYASHTDSLGRNLGARLAAFGYQYYPYGENIAGGYPDAQNTFNQWRDACDADATGACTYAHRKNMLNAGFTAIGIGRASNASSTYGWYWTTDFGGYVDKPMSQTPSPTPTPTPTPTPSAPVINSFSAAPQSIRPGDSVTLTWWVSGATSLSIDNGIGNVSSATSKIVKPYQTTTYRLTAANAGGSTTASVAVTVNNTATDTQPPTVPALSSAIAKAANQVDIAWSSSSDNVAVTGYQVVRNGAPVASVAGSARSYTDRAVNANTTYYYSVRAFDAAGNYSGLSNSAQVTTPAVTSSGTCPSPTSGAFTGCYYNNASLTGNPTLVRTDQQINFDWGVATPASSITSRDFSVRWQGYFNFEAATYTFNLMASDGIRLYVDGDLVLDRWRDQPAYMYAVRRSISAGAHLISVEYYEHTGLSTAHLSWQKN